uniref:Cytochrome P450 n=1 Tax=Stomoxys calcitrans TaxID=35570 RepID=A0A1I8PG17_STOCA
MLVANWFIDVLAKFFIFEIWAILLGLLGVVVYGIYHFKYKHIIEVTRNIPSPPTWPIVGHGPYFMFKQPHEMVQTMAYLEETYAKPMKFIKIWLGTELNIVTGDLKDLEIILGGVQHLEKAGEYKALAPWLGGGLLVSHGRKWHQRRKIITPAFHFSILGDFAHNFEKESRILVQSLDCEYRMQTEAGFCLGDLVNLCTLDAVCDFKNYKRKKTQLKESKLKMARNRDFAEKDLNVARSESQCAKSSNKCDFFRLKTPNGTNGLCGSCI